MSNGEIAYLTLVLSAFAIFMVVMGFISVWSQPKKSHRQPTKVAADAHPHFSRVRFG